MRFLFLLEIEEKCPKAKQNTPLIFVNKLSTSYETYSSPLFNGGKSLNISEKHSVSLMQYSFLHRGFKYSAIYFTTIVSESFFLVCDRSEFQFIYINVFYVVKFLGFSCSKQFCWLIRYGSHFIILIIAFKISL